MVVNSCSFLQNLLCLTELKHAKGKYMVTFHFFLQRSKAAVKLTINVCEVINSGCGVCLSLSEKFWKAITFLRNRNQIGTGDPLGEDPAHA